MILIDQSHEILRMDDIKLLEIAGRTCYKSEDRITETSADAFVTGLIKRGHGAMLEHAGATVRFITNRGVTHEIVRHRLASFAQESTRYVSYGCDDVSFIRPVWLGSQFGFYSFDYLGDESASDACTAFIRACCESERAYKELLSKGWRPEQAREVLPNALKTEIVVTMNFRAWIHFFNLRALGLTGRPHPQMQSLALGALKDFAEQCPTIFQPMLVLTEVSNA